MKIGLPKEIKNNESRVALTPDNVKELTLLNHEVLVEYGAGEGSGFNDEDYIEAGAKMTPNAENVWECQMVMKVKEPQPSEFSHFYEGLILFTYLHLAAEPELTKALVEKKVTAFAYETILDEFGQTPLLRPMSEVAGRRSITIGAQFLEKIHGGKGILLGGVPGVEPAKVTIIGGGIAGFNAAQMALGLGANITILELNENRIRFLKEYFKNSAATILKSNFSNISKNVKNADLLVSTILIPGAKAPKLVTTEMVKSMEEGSVIVDISIDQGGSVETITEITTHDNPIITKHGVLHYSVANMPGATPKTSTLGLTNATLPYVKTIAKHGYDAIEYSTEIAEGLNTHQGEIINNTVKNIYLNK